MNLYLVSSPLHFLGATLIALENENTSNHLLFISRNAKIAEPYAAVARDYTDVFDDVRVLYEEKGGLDPKSRKPVLRHLQNFASEYIEAVIHTGNDRRFEFQGLMHFLRALGNNRLATYIDDGAVSYVGHKSMGTLAHDYIDPFLKKLVYGRWWKQARTTGASAWIGDAYLAYPELAHELLKPKSLKQMPIRHMNSKRYAQINRDVLEKVCGDELSQLTGIDVVLVLPHESEYLQDDSFLVAAKSYMGGSAGSSNLAVKLHPRSENEDIVKEHFPSATFVPSVLGVEMILSVLPDGCKFLGSVSSALVTARLLRPAASIVSISTGNMAAGYEELFSSLGIEMIAI